MSKQRYEEHQMTPWFRLAQSPSIPGRYELRSINTKEVFAGWYSDGRWQIAFNGEFSLIRLNLSQFEWRGLNFEPPRVSLWGEHGVINIT